MTLHEYLVLMPSKADKQSFAKRVKTSLNMLYFVVRGASRCPIETAMLIERETAGKVPVESTRPDLPWHIVRGYKVRVKSSIGTHKKGERVRPKQGRHANVPSAAKTLPVQSIPPS